MSAIAAIVINDGLATPVAHTFAPAKSDSDYSLHEDRSSGIYVGFNKLTLNLTRPSGKPGAGRNLKLSIRIETPKLETLATGSSGFTPAPTVSYRPQAEITFTFPERCSLQDRKDLQAYVKNLMSHQVVTDAVGNYELPY